MFAVENTSRPIFLRQQETGLASVTVISPWSIGSKVVSGVLYHMMSRVRVYSKSRVRGEQPAWEELGDVEVFLQTKLVSDLLARRGKTGAEGGWTVV